MLARKVTERHDYGQGYAEEKFGFEIGGRIWWVGIDGYGHNSEQAASDRELCHEIINRWNADDTAMRRALEDIASSFVSADECREIARRALSREIAQRQVVRESHTGKDT